MSKTIFISHRHDDKRIADVIQKSLLRWGIPKNDIFYSSATSGQQGPRIGKSIQPEIHIAASEAKLFIWIYTFAEADWSWCAHELGLALGSKPVKGYGDTDTQVVILQCTHDEPKILRDIKRVTVDVTSLREFISTILCTYPSKEKPYRKEIDNETLGQLAKELYDQLAKVIPSEQSAEYYRWDNFTLWLSKEDVNAIQDRYKPEIDQSIFSNKLQMIKKQAVVRQAFGGALHHFGWSPIIRKVGTQVGPDNISKHALTLRDLFERWESDTGYKGNTKPKWQKEMLEEIKRAIDLRDANPTRELIKSSKEHRDDYYYPILNHARMLQDGSMEFIIYLYRIVHDVPWLNKETPMDVKS